MKRSMALGLVIAGTALLSPPAWSGGVVTNCTDANLRAAVAEGGTVTFACDGTITLTNTISITANTALDGGGHQVAISGGGQVRVFSVSTQINLTLLNLAIVNGLGTNAPGIVFAIAAGGAIFNAGTVNATNCAFMSNMASAQPPSYWGYIARGGAIYNAYQVGSLKASACSFLQNRVVGGAGSPGDRGWPGSPPSPGNSGGSGSGGAIYNEGTMTLDRTLFTSNSATGGAGGPGGNGYTGPGPAVDQPGAPGGNGADGDGAAVSNWGTGAVVNCTFTANLSFGGLAGDGGNGGQITWPVPRSFQGGNGGSGGSGFGSVSDGSGLLCLTNCTVAANSATTGAGGLGGHGVLNGSNGTSGSAWGGLKSSGSGLVNTLLATNFPGGNCFGTLRDFGHNLSSDGSCDFTNVGSMNNTDARLGPLAGNGGPTLTMALLPGSPAIDAGDTSAAPLTDQRGFPRAAGFSADIGAFEYGSMLPVLSIARPGANVLNVTVQGNSNQWCRLLASSNFSDWIPIATNQIGPNGTVIFQDSWNPGSISRFYRVAMP